METINGQTLAEARKLYRQAEASEVQAQVYMDLADALLSVDFDEAEVLGLEIRQHEVNRLTESADEMYADADDLRGRIETEWIDLI